MASAAEQILATLSLRNLASATELRRRVLVTVACLAAARLGTFVPLPGVDAGAVRQALGGSGLAGILDLFSGGAVERMAVCALGVMPYVAASIAVQLLAAFVPSLSALRKDGAAGKARLESRTRWTAFVIALVQGYGVAAGLQAAGLATSPGPVFVATTVACIAAGSMALVWLGTRITARGLGNGISVLIMAGILSRLPGSLAGAWELVVQGAVPVGVLVAAAVGVPVLAALVVAAERAQRRIPVEYARRGGGDASRPAYVPVRLNQAGVMPAIFASALLAIPASMAVSPDGFWGWLASGLGHGRPAFAAAYGALIVFFAFFYASKTFDASEIANGLKSSGAHVPGVRPGDETLALLRRVLNRVTVLGAAYLLVVCLMPEAVSAATALPFQVGGTSLLIVVSVTLEVVAQAHAILVAGSYADPSGVRLIGPRRLAA